MTRCRGRAGLQRARQRAPPLSELGWEAGVYADSFLFHARLSRQHKTGVSEIFGSRLLRPKTVQSAFDPLHLITNHPDRLLMAR